MRHGPAKLKGLLDVLGAHVARAIQIGDCARHPEHSVVGPRRQAEPRNRPLKNPSTFRVRLRVPPRLAAGKLCIRRPLPTQLRFARPHDALANRA